MAVGTGSSFGTTASARTTKPFYPLLYPVTAVSEKALSVGWQNGGHGFASGLVQSFHHLSFQGAQLLLDFGPARFNGVQIGRIGRQVEQLGSGGFDDLTHLGHMVHTQVI